MNKLRLLLTLLVVSICSVHSAWADVEINETNFPDANFRSYLLHIWGMPSNVDNVITDEMIAKVKRIDLIAPGRVASLKGIEFFTALEYLECDRHNLTSLDVSKNTALKELICTNNQLTSLNVSGCTALENLHCDNNQLTSLDVSGCTALENLHCDNNQLAALNVSGCKALKILYCNDNQLTSLDVSGCMALESLDCYNNQLTTLDVSGCSALISLYCSNNQLTSLDVSKNTALAGLNCGGNQLTSLDVSKNTALTSLYCGGNQLTSLDVSKNKALTELSCYGNPLTSLDVSNTALTSLSCSNQNLTSLKASGCSALTRLECHKNQLSALDVSGCTALKYLFCYNNQLTTLDLSGCSALTSLSCYNNPLTSLDVSNTALTSLSCINQNLTSLNVSGCLALTSLSCYNNQLTSLDVSGCSALTSLSCSDNQLTTLDVSGCLALTSLSYYNNPLTSLDVSNTALTSLSCINQNLTSLNVSGCLALTSLSCYNNQLTSLDVSGCSALTSLSCYNNQLTSLDISKNTALESLDCNNNQLTSLDVSKNTALESLDCNNNQLTALDVSKNTALYYLNCSSNQLTALDVSKNTALTELYCYQNLIKDGAMDALIESLPENAETNNSLGIIYKENEGNVMTAAQVATARAKGWKPLALSEEDLWYSYFGEGVPVPAPVDINDANFPDEVFRNLISSRFDRNKDGKLSFAERARSEIEIDNKDYHSLKGIEFFTEAECLICHNGQLTTLDLSKNKLLKEVSCQYNQIRGKGMDALVENLPTTKNAKLYIVNHLQRYNYYEGNVMTAAQVAAAKAKGWTPYHCIRSGLYGGDIWEPYAGNGSSLILPITEEKNVAFGGTSGVEESSDLSNIAVNDVLFTLDTTAGDGYDNTDQSIIVASTMSSTGVAGLETLAPGTPEFAEKFNGITIELPAGQGSVTFDCQTIGNRLLNVKIGNNPAKTYSNSERGEVNVAYNVTENTFMYIYATAVAGSRGSELTVIENALKLYGFTVKPGDPTAIEGIESDTSASKNGSDVYFDLSGRRVMTPTKGVYVKNGRKVVVK